MSAKVRVVVTTPFVVSGKRPALIKLSINDSMSTGGALLVEDLVRLECVESVISSVFGCSGRGCDSSVSGGSEGVLSIVLGSDSYDVLEVVSTAGSVWLYPLLICFGRKTFGLSWWCCRAGAASAVVNGPRMDITASAAVHAAVDVRIMIY